MSEQQRKLLMSIRTAILIILGALEDYLGMERTKEPRHRQHD